MGFHQMQYNNVASSGLAQSSRATMADRKENKSNQNKTKQIKIKSNQTQWDFENKIKS